MTKLECSGRRIGKEVKISEGRLMLNQCYKKAASSLEIRALSGNRSQVPNN